ncbi:MAG TPA: methyltransferase domain-containing protein [Candidatus Saccharimonadales bacterium]|nr:methyltransferase domain-containing protein [Candidatus Saccharimonadales bacterium]
MDYNQKTLQTYEDSKQEYINKTPAKASPHVTEWIDRALEHVSTDGSILEIGSAFGRDADYMESKGYKVQRSDATKAFVELLRKQGHKAKVLNVLTDELDGPHDMIIANAVFLHFKTQELKDVLDKIYGSLKPGGTLAFTVKEGKGSEWSARYMNGPRFFRYWQPQPLRKLVVQAGYENIELTKGTSRNAEWLHVIAKKN